MRILQLTFLALCILGVAALVIATAVIGVVPSFRAHHAGAFIGFFFLSIALLRPWAAALDRFFTLVYSAKGAFD
jgi:UPF0716 family protein affecting phage T7 exclusion